jgi:hypothetical protein
MDPQTFPDSSQSTTMRKARAWRPPHRRHGRRRKRSDLSITAHHNVRPSDVIARIMANRMKVLLGQPVMLENVTATAGSLATTQMHREQFK